MNIVVLILAAAGFIVSLYGYLVEGKMQANPSYKPACDINNIISCSRAFNSDYSKMMGVTNTIVGMVFYALVFLTEIFQLGNLVYYYAVGAAVASVIFAYLLYVKVGSFCLVCSMVYMINFSLLIATMKG